jgi:hypothetical protein
VLDDGAHVRGWVQRKLFGFTAPCFNVYVAELDPSYILNRATIWE